MKLALPILLLLLWVSPLAFAQLAPRGWKPNPDQLKWEVQSTKGEHYGSRLASHLSSTLGAYAWKTGQTAQSWEDLEKTFGKHVWDSSVEPWEMVKRRYTFARLEGSIENTRDAGTIEGELMLVPLYAHQRSETQPTEGRFTIWRLSNGQILRRWVTEPELKTFSRWPELEQKIEAAKAAVAHMPTEFPQPGKKVSKVQPPEQAASTLGQQEAKQKPPSGAGSAIPAASRRSLSQPVLFVTLSVVALAGVFLVWRFLVERTKPRSADRSARSSR